MPKGYKSTLTIIPTNPGKGHYREFGIKIERDYKEIVFIIGDKEKADMSPVYSERRIGVVPSMLKNDEIKEKLENELKKLGGSSSGKAFMGTESAPIKIERELTDYLIGEAEKLNSPLHLVPMKWRYAACAGILCTVMTLAGDSVIDGGRKEKLDKALYIIDKYDEYLPKSEQDELGWDMRDIGLKPLPEEKYEELGRSVDETIKKARKIPSDLMKEKK